MESLSSWQERKRKLEVERDELVRRLEVVERDIIKAQAGYGAIYNKDAPVLTLPVEITCLIFRDAHSVMEVKRTDDQIRMHLTEVAISHVCRQWRSTAIGLPILWSSFYYHGPSANYATLSRFQIYLERSKLHTLELWLDFRQVIRDRGFNVAILNMALTVVPRWRLVSIFFDGDSPQPTSWISTLVHFELEELHAPHLEHLALHPNISFEAEEDLASINSIDPHIFTEGAPMLKSVWLDTSAPSLYLPPLSGVTTLRFEHGKYPADLAFSLDTLRAILTLPNLENLSMFETLCDDNMVMEGIPVIPMERLRHLRVSDNDTMVFLLKILRAPLLESIMLQDAWIPVGYDGRSSAQDAAIYSFPSLASIALFDVPCDSLNSLRYFMKMTSAVRHVTIIHSNSDPLDGALGQRQMYPPSDQDSVWPHLETLTVDFEHRHTVLDHVLAEFLTSHQRRDADLTLRISDTQATAWKEVRHPQTTYATIAELCTIEELPERELRDPKPWPPGGDGVLGRRIDLEADPFTIKSKFRSL